jgi:hypothetical protein
LLIVCFSINQIIFCFRSSAKQEPEEKQEAGKDEVDFRRNGNGNVSQVEVGQEASEVPATSGPGFLKRAVSKLWKMPIEGINGVPYNNINDSSPPASPILPTRSSSNLQNGSNGSTAQTNGSNGSTAQTNGSNGSSPAAEASAKSCVIS